MENLRAVVEQVLADVAPRCGRALMDKLADMVESALKRYGSKNIRTKLDSDDWSDIQARYNEVRTELLVQGQVELLHRVEAGHDKLQDKLAELACQDDPPNLKDVYLF